MLQNISPFLPFTFSRMYSYNPEASPDSEEDLDDPYIHTVSTEEFVETVEQASQEESDNELGSNGE